MDSVTEAQYTDFLMRWYMGLFPYLRFGQAFCNEFDIHDASLFYSEDTDTAQDMAAQYLLIPENG